MEVTKSRDSSDLEVEIVLSNLPSSCPLTVRLPRNMIGNIPRVTDKGTLHGRIGTLVDTTIRLNIKTNTETNTETLTGGDLVGKTNV